MDAATLDRNIHQLLGFGSRRSCRSTGSSRSRLVAVEAVLVVTVVVVVVGVAVAVAVAVAVVVVVVGNCPRFGHAIRELFFDLSWFQKLI